MLKNKHSPEKLQKAVEKAMVNGIRRSAGLNLISFAAGIHLYKKTEVFQWFVSSLRSGDRAISHYSDGLTGCGDSIMNGVRIQFFKIIKTILTQLKDPFHQP